MSAYFNFESTGFNVVVVEASELREVIIVQRITPEGEEPRDRPIYWGTDDLGTLTVAETAAVKELLPRALRNFKPEIAPVPDAPAEPTQDHTKSLIAMSAMMGAVAGILFTLLFV